jgi:hypothetical protein
MQKTGEMINLMTLYPFKGTVRRKPRWVKSGINRNRFQRLMIKKICFVGSMKRPLQIPCTGELIFRIPSIPVS